MDVSAISTRSGRACHLGVRVLGQHEQETITDLEEVDEEDVDGEPCRMGRDRSRVQSDDADWGITIPVRVRCKERMRYAPMDGLTMTEHTSTVAILTKSDSGVNTWSLSDGSTRSIQQQTGGTTDRTRERKSCTAGLDMSTGTWTDAILDAVSAKAMTSSPRMDVGTQTRPNNPVLITCRVRQRRWPWRRSACSSPLRCTPSSQSTPTSSVHCARRERSISPATSSNTPPNTSARKRRKTSTRGRTGPSSTVPSQNGRSKTRYGSWARPSCSTRRVHGTAVRQTTTV